LVNPFEGNAAESAVTAAQFSGRVTSLKIFETTFGLRSSAMSTISG
jgi:hypothetical protein